MKILYILLLQRKLKGANPFHVLHCNNQGIPDFATERDFQELMALNNELSDPFCPDNMYKYYIQ